MKMEIRLLRLSKNVIATVKEVDGEKYYCLAEILEQLDLKAKTFTDNAKEPLEISEISGKIIWSYRTDTLNFYETVFIDEQSALKIIEAQYR